jgi:hypothetical protein
MAEKNNDHLADALAALSAGEHSEPEPHPDNQSPAQIPPPPRLSPPAVKSGLRTPPPRTPQPGAPSARPAVPAPVARPITARPAAPASAAPPSRPPSNTRAASPVAPAAPTAGRQASPPPRTGRPQAPSAAEQSFIQPEPVAPSDDSFASTDAHTGEWVGQAPADDDAMLAPAPDADTLNYAYAAKKSAARKGPSAHQGLETKRTLIPILLTTGVMFLILGGSKFVAGGDSSFAGLPLWFVGMMCGMAVVLLAFAVFTMLQVKAQLDRQSQPA